MSDENLSYDALKRRLEQAEAALAALRRGEVDLVVGMTGPLMVRVKSLVEENERLAREWQTTFDGVKDAILLLDADLRIRRVNRAAEEVFRRPAEAMFGRHCWEIMYGAQEPRPASPALRMRRSLRREKDEIQIGQRFFEETADPLLDADGNLTGAVHIVSDVTERKQAEEALRESEERFRLLAESSLTGIYLIQDLRFAYVNQSLASTFGYTVEDIIGKLGPLELTHPDDRPRVVGNIRRRVAGEVEDIRYDFKGVKKDGTIIHIEVHGRRIEYAGKIGIIGTLVDITERKRAEEELQKRFKELSAIYAASRRLQKLLSRDQLAQEIIEVLEQTLNYTYGAVLLVADDGETLVPFALSAQKRGEEFLANDKEYVRSKNMRVGEGITGWVAQHGQSVRVDDALADPRYLSIREDVRSELCVPLLVGKQVIGVVNIESTEIGVYSENDQRLLETIAAQISVALQNELLLEDIRLHRDRLAELSRRLAEARETEQRALGRELHDQFGQMLTALKLTLETAAQLPPEKNSQKTEQARQIADELLSRVRALSLELRPPMLDDLGLQPALLWLVNHYEQTSGIKAEFKQRGLEGARFDTQIETAAYRIAQEALTNAARHTHAARVRLEVRVEAGRMHIEIEDDGAGFDTQAVRMHSRGLSGMRERAELVGGTFRIESQIGRGTRLFVSLPVENAS